MKFLPVLLLSIVMVGCAGTSDIVKQKNNDPIADELSAVASEIRDEMKRMNVAARPVAENKDVVVTGCAARPVSIDFDGGAMLFIEDLRKSKFCDIRITGKKPHQQLVLSLHHKKVPLWKVLEDAGVQLGRMASVTVSANSVAFNFGARSN